MHCKDSTRDPIKNGKEKKKKRKTITQPPDESVF